MKLTCVYADTCLPDFWSGHHLPHVQIPVEAGMTLEDIKLALRNELWQDAVGGSKAPDELNGKWYIAAEAAVDAITPVDDHTGTFFNDLEPATEDGDSVYAFFVFIEEAE